MSNWAVIGAAVIIAGGLLGAAALNRYELGGSGAVVRIDRLTGEVSPCTRRESKGSDDVPEYRMECSPVLRAW